MLSIIKHTTMKYITPQQFLKLPLSQAIRQVLLDIQQLCNTGTTINMVEWLDADEDGRICTVCFAGAALASFPIEADTSTGIRKLYPQLGIDQATGDRITDALDSLRLGQLSKAWKLWYNKAVQPTTIMRLNKIHRYSYIGHMDSQELTKMHAELTNLADKLQAIGY